MADPLARVRGAPRHNAARRASLIRREDAVAVRVVGVVDLRLVSAHRPGAVGIAEHAVVDHIVGVDAGDGR